jgi:hypothetical protein
MVSLVGILMVEVSEDDVQEARVSGRAGPAHGDRHVMGGA